MKHLFFSLSIFIAMHIFSQDSLQNLNYTRNQIIIKGMKVLAGWGITNLTVGAIGWASSHKTGKYFYR